jgi:hypothetical protein
MTAGAEQLAGWRSTAASAARLHEIPMSSISVPSLALLVLQGTAPNAGLGPLHGPDASSAEARQGSAYAELAVRDGSPYAEIDVPRVPWSHGVSYRGWDALDMLAELAGAARPAERKTA